MELVACTPADVPARMNEIQWQAMWRHYILPGHVKPPDDSFAAGVKGNDFCLPACLIAVVDGQDAGFCWGALRGDEGWCGGFGVRPEYRGQRLGQPLLHGVAEALAQHGAKVWRLEVVQQNHAAVASYLRAGFTQGRDLGLFRGSAAAPLAPGETIAEATAAECLDRYAVWPQIRRTWGAGPAQLRQRQDSMSAKVLQRDGEPVAFLLHGGNAVIDIGLAPGEPGLSGLKLTGTLPAVSINNWPADDPTRAEFDRCPTAECWVKQWEMIWEF